MGLLQTLQAYFSWNPIRCRKSSFIHTSQPLSYFTLTLSAFIRAWTFFFFSCLLWFGLVYLRSRVALGLIYCLPNTLADRVNGRPNPYRVVLSNWIFSNYFGSKLWFILQGLLKDLQIKRSINSPWTFEV